MHRGEIYLVDLNGLVGSEQTGVRPAVIVQNDVGNTHSPTTIICPLTSKSKNMAATHVSLDTSDAALKKESIVLVDSTLSCAEEIIRKTPTDIMVSNAHHDRICDILENKPESEKHNKISKRAIIILIAALIILLTSCAKFYEKIAEFFITAFGTYNRIEATDETDECPQIIQVATIPQKMIIGYELVKEEYYTFSTRLEWRDSAGNYIAYTQRPLPYGLHATDNEVSHYAEIIIDNHTIYFHRNSELNYRYIWQQDYEFHLESSRELTLDELFFIISSIK